MSSVVYEGSPLDDYLKESEITEATELAREEVVELIDEDQAPGAYHGSASALMSTTAWENVCLRVLECLPIDLIRLLGLSPITPKRTSLTERGRYLLCSSNLLDATLPRTTESESELNTPTSSSSLGRSQPSSHAPPTATSPTSSSFGPISAETPPNPHQLVILGCIPLLSLVLPIPTLWRTALFVILALLAFCLALLVKIAPSTLESRLEDLAGEGGRAQRELVERLRELVTEAEGLDRMVNSVLRRVADADKASSPPRSPSDLSPLPLSPLRQSLLSNLVNLTSLANSSTTALLPYTSTFELSILSSMYGLVPPASPRSPTSPTSPAGLRPFASNTRATKRLSVPLRPNFNRFISPPRSREPSASSEISSGESAESHYSPGKFTALPPRTPRSTKRQTWTASSAPRGGGSQRGAFSPRPAGQRDDFSSLLPSLLPSDEDDVPTPLRRVPSLDLTSASPSPGFRITKRLSHQGLLYAPHLPSSPVGRTHLNRAQPPPSPIRSPLSPIGIYTSSSSARAASSTPRTRRTTLPSQPRPIIVESEEEGSEGWDTDASASAPAPFSPISSRPHPHLSSASSSQPLSRTTSHPLPRRSRPASSLYSPSPFVLSEADEEEEFGGAADEDDPSPMSHGHLLSTFLTLHTRRRHTLVSLLALRKESSSEYWEDLAVLVHGLSAAFMDARASLARAVALSRLGGGAGEGEGWAPPSGKAKRDEWVKRLEGELEKLAEGLREGATCEDDDGGRWWESLRGDLGGLVRMWERGREEMGTHPSTILGSNRAPPKRPAPEFDSLLDENADPLALLELDDAEDEPLDHTDTTVDLPPIGREVLFAASTSSSALSGRGPASTLSRAERIALARSSRAEKVESGPRVVGLGDVVSELKGLMGELRRLKGPVGSPFDEEEEEGEEAPAQVEEREKRTPPTESIARFGSPSPSSSTLSSSPSPPEGGGSRASFIFPGLPPPPNRSSLPALSCGSSDGEDERSFEGELEEEAVGGGWRSRGEIPEGLGCGGSESTLGAVGEGEGDGEDRDLTVGAGEGREESVA